MSALSVKLSHTTSPSALEWSVTPALPVEPTWSSSGSTTPRQSGCGWTWQMRERALRPARSRALKLTAQTWGRSRRWRWEFVQNVIPILSHSEKYRFAAWNDFVIPTLQLGHDGATPESCWLVEELSLAVPTKGVKYTFACKCWLAKDRGDGLTARVFNILDAEAISISQKVSN